MKTPHFVKGCLTAITVGAVALASVSANAETLVGVSFPSLGAGDNDVITFDSANPGTILSDHPITGLTSGETIRGIDYWNGTVYALGSGGNLYNLDYNTGAATTIGHFGVLNGASYGVDNETGGFRIVSELGQNLLVNRATGTLISSAPNVSSGLFLSGLAFRASTGTQFAIDSSANTMGIFNPLTGGYTLIGALGFDVARNNGFDISGGTGIAYLVSGASSSDVQANLYQVNLLTGAATLVGLLGQPGDNTLLRGLTVVPEPGTATLVLGGLGLLAMHLRRRR